MHCWVRPARARARRCGFLAGLDTPTSGRVFIDDRDITATDARDRDIAMVFQSYALYPHMTVYENIAFPLEMARLPAVEIEPAVKDAARKVKIDHLLDRKPGQLSGGQQQRCALARAIVRKARLFLLDEPLSNLDAKLRMETRAELKKLQRSLGVTAVYVTHDQEEAMTCWQIAWRCSWPAKSNRSAGRLKYSRNQIRSMSPPSSAARQ